MCRGAREARALPVGTKRVVQSARRQVLKRWYLLGLSSSRARETVPANK